MGRVQRVGRPGARRGAPLTAPALYDHAVDGERIRGGQRRLIFATAQALGLRDEQLFDLVEGIQLAGLADDPAARARPLAQLTMGEARQVIGVLKRLERNRAALLEAYRATPGTPSHYTDDVIRLAARRAAEAS